MVFVDVVVGAVADAVAVVAYASDRRMDEGAGAGEGESGEQQKAQVGNKPSDNVAPELGKRCMVNYRLDGVDVDVDAVVVEVVGADVMKSWEVVDGI